MQSASHELRGEHPRGGSGIDTRSSTLVTRGAQSRHRRREVHVSVRQAHASALLRHAAHLDEAHRREPGAAATPGAALDRRWRRRPPMTLAALPAQRCHAVEVASRGTPAAALTRDHPQLEKCGGVVSVGGSRLPARAVLAIATRADRFVVGGSCLHRRVAPADRTRLGGLCARAIAGLADLRAEALVVLDGTPAPAHAAPTVVDVCGQGDA